MSHIKSDVKKTALLFPGLDALFMSSKLQRWLENPNVCQSVLEASKYLEEFSGEKEDLIRFIEIHRRPHFADFDRTLVALTALQIGIARQITNHWDIALGCSHGDIARSVICESISFRDAIAILWTFAELRKTCPSGCTANVRTRDGSPLKPEQLQWLRDNYSPVSQWSDDNATIGVDNETLAKISAQSEHHGLKIKPVLKYPVHSPVMQPSVEILRARSVQWPVKTPMKPIFSSLWIRYLRNSDDIREEALVSAVQEVRWIETLSYLHEKEAVDTFLNVGPSNTLTGWIFNNPRFQNLRLVDSWDLLHAEGGNR
jgi:acyl transferase domain-containing protein